MFQAGRWLCGSGGHLQHLHFSCPVLPLDSSEVAPFCEMHIIHHETVTAETENCRQSGWDDLPKGRPGNTLGFGRTGLLPSEPPPNGGRWVLKCSSVEGGRAHSSLGGAQGKSFTSFYVCGGQQAKAELGTQDSVRWPCHIRPRGEQLSAWFVFV